MTWCSLYVATQWVAIFGVSAPAVGGAPVTPQVSDALVTDEDTLVFEQPSLDGNVLRRLYVGEIVSVQGAMLTDDGREWAIVALGHEVVGYALADSLSKTTRVPVVHYRPSRIVREEHPLGVGLRLGGESFGTTLALRYQPFSRLGIAFGLGSVVAGSRSIGIEAVVTPARLRGVTYSVAVTSFLMLGNFSPVVELGVANVNFDKQGARLTVTNFFTTVGLEWMFNRGVFVGASVTYSRSFITRVSYEFRDASSGSLEVPSFGALDPGDENVFQAVQPGLIVGYAF